MPSPGPRGHLKPNATGPASNRIIGTWINCSPVKKRVLNGLPVTPMSIKKELAFLGHGGLCRDCAECTYPHCGFGKGS